MLDEAESIEKSRKLVHELDQTDLERWLQFGVFSYRWWLLVAFIILPWVIWAKLADKSRSIEIVLVGTLVMVITLLLDVLGYNLDFWDYPVEIFPLGVPGALPFDLSMVPVAYMLIYQYCRRWRSYLAALLGMAAVYAFIGEPLCNWMELVLYIKWRNYYSFVYYILLGIGVRVLVSKMSHAYRQSVAR